VTRYKSDDIELLLPTFRERVRKLMARMVELGFAPVLFDGVRTLQEAQANAAKGTGIAKSVHCYGAAADIVCGFHGWACAAKRCKFYRNLGREAEALGLLWGGRFPSVDQPHVQGVAISQQNDLRKLGMDAASAAARDALVSSYLAGR
jgi:D-alanyl-D-alanine carboxypeptidase